MKRIFLFFFLISISCSALAQKPVDHQVLDGVKKRLKVPARVLKMLKKSGVTTHFKQVVKAA